VQKIADDHHLKLLSPAVNFCGGTCQDTRAFDYLDDFIAACPGCRIDGLAIHIYVGCAGANGNHARWMIGHIKTYEQRFTQPLWLTEFACNDATNEDEQKAFLVDAVTYLESDPRIERYAWFAGRADNVPHVDLLGVEVSSLPSGKRTLTPRTRAAAPREHSKDGGDRGNFSLLFELSSTVPGSAG
jgi:hypothetical protein